MHPQTLKFSRETAETPPSHTRFAVGEHVEVNGVPFRIRKITAKDIVIRPVRATGTP